MRYLIWARGLVVRRWVTLAVVSWGVAVSVAMTATLAGFIADTRANMTHRAIADVPVDWQVELTPGADAQAAADALRHQPGASQIGTVGYFDTPGLEATASGTVQTTGAGKVLGLPDDYRAAFPSEVRPLIGEGRVLLAQQTAANLHAVPGTMVSIRRAGLPPVDVTIDAIVDLPNADTLFSVAKAAGSGPQAPPDNVVILPLSQWHELFGEVAASSPDAVRVQLHATIPHALPADPSAAFDEVQQAAHNYEARLAGAGVVNDNLAARLDAARSDARYAQALFVLLGVPGIALAGLLTVVVVSAESGRRRREQALLRVRGASTSSILRFASAEALLVALAGTGAGLAIATIVVRVAFGRWALGATTALALQWTALAAAGGLLVALLAVLVPATFDARNSTVMRSRILVRRGQRPLWERYGFDIALLALSGVTLWATARGGYQVVVAPEAGARLSVSYTSFLPPLLFWSGASLLVIRIAGLVVVRGKRYVRAMIRPIAGPLASVVSSSLSRQRILIGTGLLVVAVGLAFAGSTAVFNSTYAAQSRVDAELTNGADVTVSSSGGDLTPQIPTIIAQDGVQAAEPMQHRFAYVGADLQDLFGIRPESLRRAARVSDAFFASSSADTALRSLSDTPNGVLVAAETARDFQLQQGDEIRLRLQSVSDHQYHAVPFRFLGIVREFPTAPMDSFIVANAQYIAEQTGAPSFETVLIKTSGSPPEVAGRVRAALQATSGATVRDIDEQQRATNSSLTAISVRGLTRIEMGFGAALAAVGSALVLALGLEERRRTLAIAWALGARSRQLGAFVWTEAAVMLLGGAAAGVGLAWGLSWMLVKLLTGVFDPPPTHLAVPWAYLAATAAATFVPVVIVAAAMTRIAARSALETLRSF